MQIQTGVAIAPRRLGHLNLFVTNVEEFREVLQRSLRIS